MNDRVRHEVERLRHEIDERMRELEREQKKLDRAMFGGEGGKGQSIKQAEMALKIASLEKWRDRQTRRAWMVVLSIVGGVVATFFRKLFGAGH